MGEKKSVNRKIPLVVVTTLVICFASIAGTIVYYQSLLVTKETQILSMSNLVEESSSQIENLTNSIIEKGNQIDDLDNEIISLTSEKDGLSSQISTLKNEKINLESQIADLNSQIQTLQATQTTDPEIEDLQTEIESLQQQIESLEVQISTLENIKSDYENQIAALTNQTETLQLQIEDKNIQISDLQTEIENQQSNITSLTTQNEIIQNQLDIVQENYDTYVDSYQTLRYEVNQRSTHSDPKAFITPSDPEVTATMQTITGGWSDTSDFDEFWTDIKKLYTWVSSNIDYRYDGLAPILPYYPGSSVTYRIEMWQFPNETLELEKGDCDDQAILLCSMIRCYSNQIYDTDCIWISGSESAHLGVQVPVPGDKLVILDPAGNYYSKDGLGNIVFNDVSVEINNWLNYWKSTLGFNVYVYRIFSDSRDETFVSTSDYVDWMLS